jgi:hypothetical protein
MNPIPEGTNLNDKKQFVKAINNLKQEDMNRMVQQKKEEVKMDQLSNMLAMMTKQFEGKSPEEMMKEYQKLQEKVQQKEGKK